MDQVELFEINQRRKMGFRSSSQFFAHQAVCGGIEELTDYTLLSKGKKEGKVLFSTQSNASPVNHIILAV